MDYFNKILNKKTKHQYRFKTREEFEDQYGDYWAESIKCNWYDDDDDEGMNYLFGTDIDFLPLEEINDILEKNHTSYYDDEENGFYWNISKDMIIQNDQLNFKSIYLGNKKNIYEKRIIRFNKYKKGD